MAEKGNDGYMAEKGNDGYMAEKGNDGWRPGRGLSILYSMAGIAAIVEVLRLGPIDLGRTVYNQIIGDTPVIKRQLVDYCRRDIQRRNPNYTTEQVDRELANELEYRLEDGRINSQAVSIERLWDASEDHAKSWYQRWVWPSLDE